MNEFLKLAYDAGASQAEQDLLRFLEKEAGIVDWARRGANSLNDATLELVVKYPTLRSIVTGVATDPMLADKFARNPITTSTAIGTKALINKLQNAGVLDSVTAGWANIGLTNPVVNSFTSDVVRVIPGSF